MTPSNPLHDEIALLRRRIDELEAEVLIARRAAAAHLDNETIYRLRTHFKTGKACAGIMALLSAGGVKSREQLWECWNHSEEAQLEKGSLDVFIHRVRKILGRDALISHRGTGYSMSAEARAVVRAAAGAGGKS